MTNSQHYREKAEQARRLGSEMTAPVNRTMLLNIAAHWTELAEQAEREEAEAPRQDDPES